TKILEEIIDRQCSSSEQIRQFVRTAVRIRGERFGLLDIVDFCSSNLDQPRKLSDKPRPSLTLNDLHDIVYVIGDVEDVTTACGHAMLDDLAQIYADHASSSTIITAIEQHRIRRAVWRLRLIVDLFVVSPRLNATLMDSYYPVDNDSLELYIPKAVMVFMNQMAVFEHAETRTAFQVLATMDSGRQSIGNGLGHFRVSHLLSRLQCEYNSRSVIYEAIMDTRKKDSSPKRPRLPFRTINTLLLNDNVRYKWPEPVLSGANAPSMAARSTRDCRNLFRFQDLPADVHRLGFDFWDSDKMAEEMLSSGLPQESITKLMVMYEKKAFERIQKRMAALGC
ncbi:hypothetical protein LTS18_009809, partial [Coniosporium uncinatum]